MQCAVRYVSCVYIIRLFVFAKGDRPTSVKKSKHARLVMAGERRKAPAGDTLLRHSTEHLFFCFVFFALHGGCPWHRFNWEQEGADPKYFWTASPGHHFFAAAAAAAVVLVLVLVLVLAVHLAAHCYQHSCSIRFQSTPSAPRPPRSPTAHVL